MSHIRGYPLLAEALRRAGLALPPDAEPPTKQARAAPMPKLVHHREIQGLPMERFVSGSKKGWSKKRVALWYAQGGLCHWCGRQTILFEPRPKARLPANAATIDHLRSRLDPRRTEKCRGDRRLVMACNLCNNRRGSAEQREADSKLLRQALWERNGNLFKIAKMSGALNEVDGLKVRE